MSESKYGTKYPTTFKERECWVIIETRHGAYTEDGFVFVSEARSLEEAIGHMKDSPKLYYGDRIVNRDGITLYDSNAQPA